RARRRRGRRRRHDRGRSGGGDRGGPVRGARRLLDGPERRPRPRRPHRRRPRPGPARRRRGPAPPVDPRRPRSRPPRTGRPAGPAQALHDAVVARHYPWTDAAPEAVALALAACLHGGGDVEASVTFAVSLGRDADTIAAIAGAVAGAGQGESGVPARWAARI